MDYTGDLYPSQKYSLHTENNYKKYLMNKLYIDFISKQLSVHNWQVEHCAELLEEGATIPFISRYRKERTGSLDEILVAQIKHYHSRFTELDKRKRAVLSSIEEQGKLSESLEKEITTCVDSQKLEDLYLPFRPKRKTKASLAKERGLEPLALKIFSFQSENPFYEAEKYLNSEVPSIDEALSGAREIIAEWISENIRVRELLREQYLKFGKLVAKKHKDLAQDNDSKYSNYFSFEGTLNNMPAHRVLALLRGEREGDLSVKLEIDSHYSIGYIRNVLFPSDKKIPGKCREQIEAAIDDSYKRLLHPSIENETLNSAKARADIESIKVFGNVNQSKRKFSG